MKLCLLTDDYENIRTYTKRYCATGSTDTPVHGRGQRTTKKNGRYIESDQELEETEPKVTQEKVFVLLLLVSYFI